MGLGMANGGDGRGFLTASERLLQDLSQETQDRQYQAKLEAARAFGADIYEDGQVLRFRKQLTPAVQEYTFAAIKAAGLWWLSGRRHSTKPLTWFELVVFWMDGRPVTRVEVMGSASWIGPAAPETVTREAEQAAPAVTVRGPRAGDGVVVRGVIVDGSDEQGPALRIRINGKQGSLTNDCGAHPLLGEVEWLFGGDQ